MARPFLTDEAKQALTAAVRAVEAASSAELVVAVRPRSGSYVHADLAAGLVAAFLTVGVLLYSPWPFGLIWFLLDPLLAGLAAGLISTRLPAVRRTFTPPRERRARVETAARATFVEKRVHATSGRTGVLLYISLLERDAALVVDLGVETLARTAAWQHAAGEVLASVRRGDDGVAVARALEGLAAVLAPALAPAADDVDELPNEVCAP
jgi:putative membrane protein